MSIILIEAASVIFGSIALVVPKLLNPKVKFTCIAISEFSDFDNCKNVYRFSLALCYLTNSIALYLYIGPIGLLFLTTLISVFAKCSTKLHLITAFIGFSLYSVANIIYNPLFLFNYLPLLAFLYTIATYLNKKVDSIGLVCLTYSAAILMILNTIMRS